MNLRGGVIGRLRIDPLVLKVAKDAKMDIFDFSTIPSFHQGFTDSREKSHYLSMKDYYYNLRFIRFSDEGRLLANYRIYKYSVE